MLMLFGITLDGDEIKFCIDEISTVYKSDGVLYITRDGVNIPLEIDTIAPAGDDEPEPGLPVIGKSYLAKIYGIEYAVTITGAVDEDDYYMARLEDELSVPPGVFGESRIIGTVVKIHESSIVYEIEHMNDME